MVFHGKFTESSKPTFDPQYQTLRNAIIKVKRARPFELTPGQFCQSICIAYGHYLKA